MYKLRFCLYLVLLAREDKKVSICSVTIPVFLFPSYCLAIADLSKYSEREIKPCLLPRFYCATKKFREKPLLGYGVPAKLIIWIISGNNLRASSAGLTAMRVQGRRGKGWENMIRCRLRFKKRGTKSVTADNFSKNSLERLQVPPTGLPCLPLKESVVFQ